jgi:beta-galactosidase/beta-glucuronidase
VTASIAGLAGASANVSAAVSAGETIVSLRIPVSVDAGVALWWPNGYGAQTLYNLSISAVAGNGEAQSLAARVGFRTIEVDQPPLASDEAGLVFNPCEQRDGFWLLGRPPALFRGALLFRSLLWVHREQCHGH